MAAEEPADIYWDAQRLELAGRNADALKSYAKLLTRAPTSEAAANNLLAAAVREGSLADAVTAVRAAQKAGTADTDAPLLLYVDAMQRRNWREAQAAIVQLQAAQNFAFMVPMLNGWLNVAQGRASGFSDAQLQTDGLAAYYGNDQLIYFDLADQNLPRAQFRLRSFGGFVQPYGQYLARYASAVFTKSGDTAFAAALQNQVGLEASDSVQTPIGKGVGLAALFGRLALALDEQKQPDEALYFARLAMWSSPDSDAAKLTFATVADDKLKGKAEAVLASIPSQSPFWSLAVVERSRLTTDATLAVKLAREGLANRPKSAQLKLLLARALEQAGQRDEAIPLYRSLAATQGRQRASYLLLLASALDADGNWKGARAALEEAVAIDPQNSQVLNYLGYSLLERRIDVKRGFDLVAKAYALAPQSAAITDSFGWAHFLQGDVNAAIPLLEKAVIAAIDDVAVNEHLGDAYWASNRKTEARFAWKAAALSAKDKAALRLAQKIDFGWTAATAAP